MQLSATLLRLTQGLALGALSGLGRPGCDLAPAYLLGVLGLAYYSLAEARWQRAVCVAFGWGLGMATLSGLGAYSWGLDVVAFIVTNVFLYGLVAVVALPRPPPHAFHDGRRCSWRVW